MFLGYKGIQGVKGIYYCCIHMEFNNIQSVADRKF